MLSQNQLLAHYVQTLGTVNNETLQAINHQGISLQNYLQQHKVLSQQQWDSFRWLYIEYTLLFYAQQEGRITYNNEMFSQLIYSAIHKTRDANFYFLKPQMLSGETLRTVATKLLQQGLLSQQEMNNLWKPIDQTSHKKTKQISHYELLTELGRGGMGVVYKVKDIRNNKTHALKLILANKEVSEISVKRFEREKNTLMRLNHPHIVRFHDAGVINGSCYLVMDFIDGYSLQQTVQQHSIPDVVEMIKKLAQALEYAHHNHVIHRDLKPANIMINTNSEPILMDFGIARVTDAERLTISGRVPGSPRYMSPEQAQGKVTEFDARSDIYSLGVIFYELITGQPVVSVKILREALDAVINGIIILPSEVNPNIPNAVEKVCMRCLAKSPNKRYQNANELVSALEDLILSFSQQPNQHYWQSFANQKSSEKSFSTIENLINPSSNSIAIGDKFRNYIIESELGRGGMGVVYKVLDTQINRHVALKVVQSQQLQDEGIKRFMLEIQAVARLNHPNVIRLFEYGNEPQTYYTMEYIEGITFKSFVQNKRLPIKKIAEVIKKTAEALHSVHQEKIIHRDIKPANIMIMGDEPKVMDFGLAKVGDSQLSQTGTMLGTLAYMSPEQADGKNVTRRSDIYSLGATLYEALTKRPPFQGQSTANILNQVYNVDPIPPRQLNPDIDRDLEVICMKCLEKDPKKRYQTAAMLTRDLQNYLNNVPIHARPPGLVEKMTKWCQRRPVIAVLIVVINIAMILILFSWSQTYIAYQSEHKALSENIRLLQKFQKANLDLEQTNKKLAKVNQEKSKLLEEKNLALLDVLQQRSQEKIQNRNYTDATHHFFEAYKILKEKNSKSSSEYLQKMLLPFQYNTLLHLPLRQEHHIYQQKGDLALAKNGKVIGCLVGSQTAGKRLIYQMPGTKNNQEITLQKDMYFYMNFSNDGKYIGALVERGEKKEQGIVIINLATKKQKFFPHKYNKAQLLRLAFSYNNEILAIKSHNYITLLYPTSGKIKVLPLNSMLSNTYHLAFSPKGIKLASLIDGKLLLWERISKISKPGVKKQDIWKSRDLPIRIFGKDFPIQFSPNGNTIACGDRNGNITLYNTKANNFIILSGHKGDVLDISFSADGQFLVSVGQDTQLILWNLQNREIIFRRHFPNIYIQKVAFTNQSHSIALLGSKGKNQVVYEKWDIQPSYANSLIMNKKGQEIFDSLAKSIKQDLKFILHKPAVFSSDNKYIAVPYTQSVFLWNIKTKKNFMLLADNSLIHPEVQELRFSPNSKLLAVRYRKGRIIIFRTKDGIPVNDLKDRSTTCMDFLDEKTLVFNKNHTQVIFYDILQKRIIHQYKCQVDVTGIRVNANGKWITLGGLKSDGVGYLQVLQASNYSASPLIRLNHDDRTNLIAWHPNSSMIATGCTYNGVVTILRRSEQNNWKIVPQKVPLNFSEGLKALSFSPERERLAVFLENDSIVYDIKTGFRTSITQSYLKRGVANFSPNWRYLVLPGLKGSLHLFDLNRNSKWVDKNIYYLTKIY